MHYAVKLHGSVGVKPYAFLTLALEGKP